MRTNPSWAFAVMALYAPEELAAFDKIFNPEPKPVAVNRHEQMLVVRQEIARLAEAERAIEPAIERAPEAYCRGYTSLRPHQQPRPTDPALTVFEAPGDDVAASRAWLRHQLGGIDGFAEVANLQEIKDGHARGIWRAAAALLITRPRGQVSRPLGYLAAGVSHLACGYAHDIRGNKDFAADTSWPAELIRFARADLSKTHRQERRTGTLGSIF